MASPRTIASRIRRAPRKVAAKLAGARLALAASSRFTAATANVASAARVSREAHAVVSGWRKYRRDMGSRRGFPYGLRKNIHKLEKGFTAKARRSTYGTAFIEQTVRTYGGLVAAKGGRADAGELAWAHDVMSAYFGVVTDDAPQIARARRAFESLPTPPTPGDRSPFSVGKLEPSRVSYADFLHLAENRRSVRWFSDEPVSRDDVDKAIAAAVQAPSSCNRLPYEFVCIDDRKTIDTVARIPAGATTFAHQIPMLIVVKGRWDAIDNPGGRHVPYIDASLATMGLALALRTLGMHSVLINWPDQHHTDGPMEKALGFQPYERTVVLMAVGHADPDGWVPRSAKKELDTIRTYWDPSA